MNGPWTNPWQPNYYPQPPNSAGFIPPPPYGQGYWDSRAYGRIERPSNFRSSKYPNLNPILAADTTLLRFDVRKKPDVDILTSTFYSSRHSPATAPATTRLRLISKAFPWTIDIISLSPITCEAVWDALFTGLQEPIADSEWGLIVGDKKKREAMVKATKSRTEGGQVADKRMRRIDYLGEATHFKGLEQDEDFQKMRLLPGDSALPDTWVVKLASP